MFSWYLPIGDEKESAGQRGHEKETEKHYELIAKRYYLILSFLA